MGQREREKPQVAAYKCLDRMITKGRIPEDVRLRRLIEKHQHSKHERNPLDRIDWESVLAEVIVVLARRDGRGA